jgi:hypothetical protein
VKFAAAVVVVEDDDEEEEEAAFFSPLSIMSSIFCYEIKKTFNRFTYFINMSFLYKQYIQL